MMVCIGNDRLYIIQVHKNGIQKYNKQAHLTFWAAESLHRQVCTLLL
jgi:hypothetical protein